MKFKYLGLVLLFVTLYYGLKLTDPVYQLKQHKNWQLICQMPEGEQIIPKNKIISYIEEEDYWVFSNGYAKNCYILKMEGE